MLRVGALLCVSLAPIVHGCSVLVANFDLRHAYTSELLASANALQQRRGPDATNLQTVHGWSFLHNLLSMTGAVTLQPFVSADNRTVALFNGEVYNYLQIAHELTGRRDAFPSDGYSLLPAYARWGERFVQHLRGEFAIVLVDFARGRMVLTGDVFGTKPLWYATWGGEAHGEGGREGEPPRFLAASYRSVLQRLGVPEGAHRSAPPNEALVFRIPPLGVGRGASHPSANRPSPTAVVETAAGPSADSSPRSSAMRSSATRSSATRSSATRSATRGRAAAPSLLYTYPLVEWDLHQHKTTTHDFTAALLEAVRTRVRGIKHRAFIGLSSGYDSGAIMLALTLLQHPFLGVTLRADENMSLIAARAAFARSYANMTVLIPSAGTLAKRRRWLQGTCEPWTFSCAARPGQPLLSDTAAVGLSFVLAYVREQRGLIYLSGTGVDEIVSDYAVPKEQRSKRPPSAASCFGGRFPANLSTIFPWCNFYFGSQRDYLMKEELVSGVFGIEGRYPFLDPQVVQEFLWLHPSLKNNAEYKKPLADLMDRHGFPFHRGRKLGFYVDNSKRIVAQQLPRSSSTSTTAASSCAAGGGACKLSQSGCTDAAGQASTCEVTHATLNTEADAATFGADSLQLYRRYARRGTQSTKPVR